VFGRDIDSFRKLSELKEYTQALLDEAIKLKQELQKANDKVSHFEEIAKFSTSPLSVGSNEEEVCKLEIRRLHDLCKSRPLEFNEVKAFEIFVNSLLKIQGKPSEDTSKRKSKKQVDLTQDQLIQLAMQVTDESGEQ
jgi:hypothetical protein